MAQAPAVILIGAPAGAAFEAAGVLACVFEVAFCAWGGSVGAPAHAVSAENRTPAPAAFNRLRRVSLFCPFTFPTSTRLFRNAWRTNLHTDDTPTPNPCLSLVWPPTRLGVSRPCLTTRGWGRRVLHVTRSGPAHPRRRPAAIGGRLRVAGHCTGESVSQQWPRSQAVISSHSSGRPSPAVGAFRGLCATAESPWQLADCQNTGQWLARQFRSPFLRLAL